jgi:uncharacterized protein YecT (DUF1311 family)
MRYLAVIVILSSIPRLAQDSQRPNCKEPRTQPEMNACAGEEADRVDAELSKTYDKLAQGKSPEYVARMRAAHDAWIGFREAYLGALYPAENQQEAYGSIYPMEAAHFVAAVARRQIALLNGLNPAGLWISWFRAVSQLHAPSRSSDCDQRLRPRRSGTRRR